MTLALCACDRVKPGAATQIAAKINKEEISVHQVNYLLQRQTGLTPDQLEDASRKTLEALVDQELVVQAATDQHLDRDPAVVQALEAARRELLARAYTERLAASVPLPTAGEVQEYYDSTPALFAKRRVYTLVDTAFEAKPAQQRAVRAQLSSMHNAAQVAAVLRQAGLRFGARRSTVGAEALPLQSVDAMAALHAGQSHLIGGTKDAHVLTVLAAEPASLTFDEARASIEGYLTGERKRERVQQQIKLLRSAARIEYRGRFAAPAASLASVTPAPAAASGLSAVSLRQGMAGLK